MDHNQLVADITIMEWCVCACMIVSCCFDFGRYGPAGHVMSDAEWFLVISEQYEESEGEKKKRLLK